MDAELLKEAEKDAEEFAKAMPKDQMLSRLGFLVQCQINKELEINAAEESLKQLKKELNDLSGAKIPELMGEMGVRDFTMKTGHKVVVKPYYSGKITDYAAYTWLQENGFGDLPKVTITVKEPMIDEDLISRVREVLNEAGITFDEDTGIHSKTLSAFLKEQIEGGMNIPRELFNVFAGFKTTIKSV
jgi:hypothetical protein